MNRQRRHLVRLLAAAACFGAPSAFAQTFPSKSITIVVPATPGGAIDLAARLIGAKLTAAWGQPVSTDNVGGAAGMLGSDGVAKAAPDGHTLALVASSHAINPSLYKKLPFDTLKAFEPVVQTHVVPLLLAVTPSVPAKNVTELVAWLKANPGKASYASSGNGGAPHMSAELFKSMVGVDLTHVPYKGSTAAHPDLPTMQEAGIAGYETSTWGGLLAPAGTPKDVVAKINAEVVKALAAPDVREALAKAGIEPAGGSPAQFDDFIRAEMTRWAKVAQAAGLQPE